MRNNQLLRRAARDRRLSLRSLGLLALYVTANEILPSSETARLCSEGRDAIRNAKNELREAGYIVSAREQDPKTGRWATTEKFGLTVTKNGFPGVGEPGVGNPGVGNSGAISNSNSSSTKETSSHRKYSVAAATKEEKVIRGDWLDSGLGDEPTSANPFAEEPAPVTKKHANGGVTVSALPKRFEKPHSQWNAGDLSAEFSWRVAQIDRGLMAQSPAAQLRPVLGRYLKEDRLKPEEIYHAIEVFFEDPRNLANLGEGAPLYKRFLASFQTNQAEARRRAGMTSRPLDELVSQADEFNAAQKSKRRF